MSLRRKKSVSPLRQRLPSPDGMGRTPGWSGMASSPGEPSPGYCIDWTSQSRRRRGLTDSRDLRSEMRAAEEDRPGDRLFVIHTLGAHVLETLRLGGVDPRFLEAHAGRRGYRPRGSVGARWWCWMYPEEACKCEGRGRGSTPGISLLRASLWMAPSLTLLLVDRSGLIKALKPPPRPPHRDGAPGTKRYGTVDRQRIAPGSPSLPTLDMEVYQALGTSPQQRLEDLVGEVVYDRWLDYADSVPVRPSPGQRAGEEAILLHALRCLEQNQDASRCLAKHGRDLGTPCHADWTDLIARLQRRLVPLSRQLQRSSAGGGPQGADGADKRALDRIAYLGGLLLPITVVSGVLAIEGDYGPQGGNFWVFWVASAITSAVAIVIIYIDQVRTLQVWIEVAADAIMEGSEAEGTDEGEEDEEVVEEVDGRMGSGGVVMQRLADGRLARVWRRKELGWGGAVKKVSGYYRLRGSPGMTFELPKINGING